VYPDDPRCRSQGGHVRSLRVPDAAAQGTGCCAPDFAKQSGKVSYHVPCHLRVQNLGLKTRDTLKLCPALTRSRAIERLLGDTWHLRREARVSRYLDEDR